MAEFMVRCCGAWCLRSIQRRDGRVHG
jgi:hypothetical protein